MITNELSHRMHRYGLNPCFDEGTMVLTRRGHYRIEELVGEEVEIWNGHSWEKTSFRVTGENQDIYVLTLANNQHVFATGYHKFILEDYTKVILKDLKEGDVLLTHTQTPEGDGIVKWPLVKHFLQYANYIKSNSTRWNVVKSVEFSHIAAKVYCCTVESNHIFGLSNGLLVGQCGEIIGSNFMCNLSEVHLNQIDPEDINLLTSVFYLAGQSVSSLLNHEFTISKFRESRELDPIVGVSFTGLFDFFVNAFGVEWLQWWAQGRPDGEMNDFYDFKNREMQYLLTMKFAAQQGVAEYCDTHGLKRPNRCTTVQPAGCLDKDAIRVFDQGLLYADEIISPGSGETVGLDLSVRSNIPAESGIANQPLNLIKVTLNNNRIIRMTPDHRFMVEGQWIQAQHMQPNMLIDYSLGQYSQSAEPLLLSINQSDYTRESRLNEVGHSRGVLTKSITTPSTMNEDLSYFLGALFGNGCLSETHKRIRVSHGRLDVLVKLSNISKNLFSIEGSINPDSRGGKFELCLASDQLYDWLQKNNLAKLEKSKNLSRIPEVIRRSSKNSILAFFAGLIDTDGCARNDRFSIDMASEEFIRCLQQVGESVGLCFGISHNTEGQNFQENKSMWSISLYRTFSNTDAVEYLNTHSLKLTERPVILSNNIRSAHPFAIKTIEFETSPDYSYDFAVSGQDDDDSWYWQGALKSHNTKSLLTGAASGWAPPKAARYIRRITFSKNDPVALASLDYGYSVVPAQKDTDDDGGLLNDPFDPRCTEWLVEIPVETCWANLPGVEDIDISQFSALAQFDFYMQVQKYYTEHNTSATIELREHEIDGLAERIHQAIENDEGYISSALLARFDCNETFPRLPFEPISKEKYEQLTQEVLERRISDDFHELLLKYDTTIKAVEGPSGCDSDKCLLPESPNPVRDISNLKGNIFDKVD